MIGYTLVVLLAWFGSLASLFWVATWQSQDQLDDRDAKSLQDASESAFFLRR